MTRIIQLSDIHLLNNSAGELLGVNTEESLQTVLQLLKSDSQEIDFIVITGDLTQDGAKNAYIRLAKMLSPLQVPVYCIPGNHDDSQLMAEVYPRDMFSTERHLILKHWQLIFLNSQKKDATDGYLDQSQLNYLQQCLQKYPKHYAMILLHHPPVPVNSAWLDKIGLSNASQFWEVISPFSNVKTILFGHIHQDFQEKINGIYCLSTPSTCIQFKPKTAHFCLENIPPGFREIQLLANGEIKTVVKRVPHYIGVFDEQANSY